MKQREIGPEAERLSRSGLSNERIAKKFRDLGLRTVRGLEWSASNVATLSRTAAYWPNDVSPHGHSSAHHVNMEDPPSAVGQLGPWILEQTHRGFNSTQIAQQLNFFGLAPVRSKVWSGSAVASILANRRRSPGKRSIYFRATESDQLEIETPMPVKSADPRSETLRVLLSGGPDEAPEEVGGLAVCERHRLACASTIASGLVQRVDMVDVGAIARAAIDIYMAIEQGPPDEIGRPD